MGMVNINDLNRCLDSRFENASDLVNGYRAMMYALEAYIRLRVGLGGSSEPFLKKSDEISEKVKANCEELQRVHNQLSVCNLRQKTVTEKLKPYVKEFKEIETDIVSLVRKGW